MKLESIRIFSYSLPFKKPIVLKGQQHTHRAGLLLRLTDQAGHVGWGEVAPLPGFSTETINEAIAQIRSLDLVSNKFSKTNSIEILRETDLYPSVRFGLEMAAYELAQPLITTTAPVRVPVNGLIVALGDITPMKITDLIQNGFRTFKIKVGRADIDSEVDQLVTIAKNLPTDCRLRLDANRSWEFDEALDFCHRIDGLPVEYIEEPLTDPERLGELAASRSIPIALDESLVTQDESSLNSLIGNPGIKALVLKPTLLGGINKTLALARMGQSHSMTVVISSSYESSIGITCLTCLAATVDPKAAHGLDTLGAFQDALVNNPPLIESGHIQTGQQADLSINMSQLTEVTDD